MWYTARLLSNCLGLLDNYYKEIIAREQGDAPLASRYTFRVSIGDEPLVPSDLVFLADAVTNFRNSSAIRQAGARDHDSGKGDRRAVSVGLRVVGTEWDRKVLFGG